MYFSPHQIANCRNQTLNNLLVISTAGIETGQSLTDLLVGSSRDAIAHCKQFFAELGDNQTTAMPYCQTTHWQESTSRHNQLSNSVREILAEAHKALIQSAEVQAEIFGQMVSSTIKRAEQASPWETGIMLHTLRDTLEAAEQTCHEVSVATIEAIDQAEAQGHETTRKPATRKRSVAPGNIDNN